MSDGLIHYWDDLQAKPLGVDGHWDDLCGRKGKPTDTCSTANVSKVTCPHCLAILQNQTAQSDDEALKALRSYSKLAVLAERERVTKILEEALAKIRSGE